MKSSPSKIAGESKVGNVTSGASSASGQVEVEPVQTSPGCDRSTRLQRGHWSFRRSRNASSSSRTQITDDESSPSSFRWLLTNETNEFLDLSWYTYWVWQQLKGQPAELLAGLPNFDAKVQDAALGSLWPIWREVRTELKKKAPSVEGIVSQLKKNGTLDDSPEPLAQSTLARDLVFAIIGWQTMLYRPDSGSCQPTQLAIVDEMDGFRGQAHICLVQSQLACRKPIHEFLLGFGVMLPCRNFGTIEQNDGSEEHRLLKSVEPDTFNAGLLSRIGGTSIAWTDSLACHLEFDRAANTVYIFRYPSFCLANLHSSPLRPTATLARTGCQKKPEQDHGTLYDFAVSNADWSRWATVEDIDQLLREILMSYRLLFGQDKASRQLFRRCDPFDDVAVEGRDATLTQFCHQATNSFEEIVRDRSSYNLEDDFAVLRSRLVALILHLKTRRPRTWKELWGDKRDSSAWYTFWAVVVIGGLGLLLALSQVVLQIIQIVLSK